MADNSNAQPTPAAGDDTQATSSSGSVVEAGAAGQGDRQWAAASNPLDDDEATVLTTSPVAGLDAEEFPHGLSPRELSLTLKGQLLDHFHLQEFIGGGGMGAVFKALDTTLDRIVAVKVVASPSVSSEDLQRRFLVEAQSTARLDHPNIARIHFVGRDRGLPYIVFEYIDGVNLRDLVVNHGTIPVGDAMNYTCQIAHALAHAWQKEVVHRDIKPSNILITRESQAKLVDMGLARFSHQVDTTENELTNTGMTLGTFDYISPEQARDPREADTRSDIYSLGCTLFYMLAGRPPFAEGTAVQKLLQHQDQRPPSLLELRPEIPASVSQLVDRMLAKSPAQRPQTPSELAHLCYGIFQELGLQPPQSLTPLPLLPQATGAAGWRRVLPWALPLTALLTVAAVWGNGGQGAADAVGFTDLEPQPEVADTAAEAVVAAAVASEKQAQPVDEEVDSKVSAGSPVGETIEIKEGISFEFTTPLTNPERGVSVLDFPPSSQDAAATSEESLDTWEAGDFERILQFE